VEEERRLGERVGKFFKQYEIFSIFEIYYVKASLADIRNMLF